MYECTVYQTTAKKPFGESKHRFKADPDVENKVLNLYPAVTYQKVLGFGSAFTDASALNYAAMSPENRERFIRLYFDKKDGLGLNFCRTHINSCDFAGKKYTYVQNGDKELATFSIAHDEENIIPMIHAALKVNDELLLFCSPWSPPAFMKTNGNMLLGGKLRPEYRQAWANYFVKYIRAYEKQGIPFFALTVQNEPMALQTWESCKFTAEETCLFVRDYLYPALKAAGLDTKIMIWDHNKEHVVDWAQAMHQVDGAAEHIWGTAFHWYSGDH
ncbi:MAG: glucosylceramidase, partial [Acutalibacteraceae bacterium]